MVGHISFGVLTGSYPSKELFDCQNEVVQNSSGLIFHTVISTRIYLRVTLTPPPIDKDATTDGFASEKAI